ncbi:MAG: SurA N-terminal domain-containing protein [Coxiellaceae bacterium]|jgi:peptidyl-prolyl cis-trans isomerase SurA|nr:SurA N-terminal domain-containing protein [Coxiellaceae bacterium]
MKNKSIKSVLAIILGLLLFSSSSGYAATLNKVVAVVNNHIITQNELDKKMTRMKQQADPLLRQKALDELIDISLQIQLAKINKIKVSDRELDDIITNIARANGLTVAQLKETLPEHEGISFTEFRNQLRENGLISKVQQAFLGKEIVIDDKEVEKLLKHPPKMDHSPVQYHVFDILFENFDDTNKEQLDLVANVVKKLRVGTNVDDVIINSQKDLKENIIRGNDLGWRRAHDFPELFAKEIVEMRVNQVVGPLTAPNGLHLLKLLGIYGGQQSVKLYKEQAYEILYRRKLTDKLKPWLKELREKAYIEIIK